MDAEYWQKAWQDDRIGFHQDTINKRLTRFWPELALPRDVPVFVPLCGKSTDMLWLHQQGHPILGVELSEKAVQAFFADNNLAYSRSSEDGYQRYTGIDAAAGIELWAGDFFALQPEHTEHCRAFYDRASLIAMNPDMRVGYASQLSRIVRPASQGLLLCIAYDESRMNGPPFSVSDNNVQDLFARNFAIKELAHYSGPERLGNLAKRGLETLDERVYLLDRTPRVLSHA